MYYVTTFCMVWKKLVPWLNSSKSGSNFCDIYTLYRNEISTAPDENSKLKMELKYIKHIEDELNKFKFYKYYIDISQVTSVHYLF